ncbi:MULTISPECIES: chorismate--pyruvate lyase family protein [Commensalibacter]|uniref:Probable chorismate pyruvate-lyase n=2 Tax=Commensalibacter TaxID=1079922 RepID=W7DZX6_9PROT|nr:MULTISPECIES: chorismate lyase [Commensalibacter]EUK18224.1 chorismate lyase [Commensalibacter papalotli (ex Servin-Garciduenas et al. 2014)]CAI3937361.1 4-hydroxybenzoate synthetase (chorismate-pyruvate lyase) (UbiC) (PDB:1FW9) [Commensalibacter papalotli (ex Botero et al. 2024)]
MIKLCWQNYNEIKDQLSIVEKDWLFDKGSLTKRLIELSQNAFSLEILSEKKQFLREDEYTILNISSLQQAWVREVILKGNDTPWVYARSIILSDSIKENDPETLKNIGKQPLGSMLFNRGSFNRSIIEVTRYPKEIISLEYIHTYLWARRSCFKSNTQTILVQEIFLPEFWKANL